MLATCRLEYETFVPPTLVKGPTSADKNARECLIPVHEEPRRKRVRKRRGRKESRRRARGKIDRIEEKEKGVAPGAARELRRGGRRRAARRGADRGRRKERGSEKALTLTQWLCSIDPPGKLANIIVSVPQKLAAAAASVTSPPANSSRKLRRRNSRGQFREHELTDFSPS